MSERSFRTPQPRAGPPFAATGDRVIDVHRILLIEDDDLLREGLKQVLEEDGYRVVAASDGGAAMELLLGGEVAPCLILLDLMMPGMNGWDFLTLHSRHPSLSKVPIVVASAYPFAEKEVVPGIVLRKPFSPARLKQLIAEQCLCTARATPVSVAHSSP
jgi:CheY-like chemotaxis protein